MVRGGAVLILFLALFAGMTPVSPVSPALALTAYSVRSDGPSPSQDDILYSIDLQTGQAIRIGTAVGFEDVESLTFDPGCRVLYGVDDETDQLVTSDIGEGTCHAVGPLGVDITDTGLAFGPDGILYMSTDAPKKPTNFYRIAVKTGKATLLGDQGQEVTGLAGNGTGVYGLGGDGASNLVKMDLSTGKANKIGPLKNVMLVDGGLDFDADGILWGIHDGSVGRVGYSQTFTVDTATGTATIVAPVKDAATGSNLDGFEGLAIANGSCTNFFPPPPVSGGAAQEIPTLGSWGLAALALALTALGVLALRRRS
jgi:hypothetical protein